MNRIEFSLTPEGTYIISENNDERLFCLGQLLLVDSLRNKIHKLLDDTYDIGLEQAQEFETEDFKVKVSPAQENLLYVTLVDKKQTNVKLETDITVNTLLDLIHDYEDALDAGVDTIILTRTQDTFTLVSE